LPPEGIPVLGKQLQRLAVQTNHHKLGPTGQTLQKIKYQNEAIKIKNKILKELQKSITQFIKIKLSYELNSFIVYHKNI